VTQEARLANMVSVKHLVAALALALAACTPPADTSDDASSGTSASGAFSAPYEIFDGDRALELTEQCSRTSPGPVESTWTPTDADVRAMEPALLERVRRELATATGSQENARDYVRQYGGLVTGGRRVIYTHGFIERIDDPDEGWRTHARIICDGGPITFGVEYDPATRQFSNFAFNGQA
jgi:hypothetical protein